MRNPYDLCIIGGGIIGCAVAFYSARLGLRPILLERGALAGGSSGINPGTVSLATKAPGEHATLALAGIGEFAWLEDCLGGTFDYVQAGSLVIFETGEERAFAERHAEGLKACGVDIAVVGAGEARNIQPILEGPIQGALWSPRDLLVNSGKLTRALAAAASKAGAEIREQSPVDGVAAVAGNWTIHSNGQDVSARWLVNAAGVGAPAVAEWVGLNHDIFPRKGQLLETTPVPAAAPVRVTSVQELLRKQGRKMTVQPGPSVDVGLTPQRSGAVFLGGTQERVGLDASLDPATLGTIAIKAARLFPSLSHGAIVRAWCGFRPATPNGHPLVGTMPACSNYIIAGGHGGDGVALAPITGRYVAELVQRQGSLPAFAHYAAQRLSQSVSAS
ncbi:NAD(P)/FAD-dependent oxidoreductase [Reyranella sp.]|uniref:NAD(P)/FAD-dependent oxidoreductase n=1 Tax=Reyranella sp. TaxID=1929291 RepID=UPI003783AD98